MWKKQMSYLFSIVVNSVDLSKSLSLRLLSKETKQIFDNNIFLLRKLQRITINYKYFIKQDEIILYFEILMRIKRIINELVLKDVRQNFYEARKIEKIVHYQFDSNILILIFETKDGKCRDLFIRDCYKRLDRLTLNLI